MRLKTLLITGISLSLAIVIGLAGSLLVLNQRFEHASQGERIAGQIADAIQQLSILTGDYLLHHHTRARAQWQARHASLGLTLNKAGAGLPTTDLKLLRQKHDQAGLLFGRVLAVYGLDGPPSRNLSPRERTLAGQLQTTMQIMASHAARLSALNHATLYDLTNQVRWLSGGLILVLVLMIALWIAMATRLIAPVRRLSGEIQSLAEDPDFRVGQQRGDEIGDLARSFNTLAGRLQQTQVSRDTLIAEMEIRKRTESELRYSEERLLEAEHTALMGHWQLDVASGRAHWSDEIHRIFGTEPSREVGPGFLSRVVHPDDWPGVEYSLSNAIEHGTEHNIEYRVTRSDGQERWLYCKANRDIDDAGKPIRLIGIAQDITERKRAEQELARANAEWTQAMDQFDDAILLVDMQGRLQRANQAFFRMIGSLPESSVGQPLQALLEPAGEEIRCSLCRALDTQRDAVITLEADDPGNPSGLPLEANLRRLRDSEAIQGGVLISLHDLSRSRQIQEKIRLSASVFENTAEGVVITDAQAEVIEVNRAFSEITGYSRDEVIGQNPSLWKSGRHDESFYRELWGSLEATGHWRGELWNRRKDGSVYPQWQTISRVNDEHGNLTHYVGVFTDISQIKQSQQQLDHLAHHDALTNLPNRLLFNERLEQAIRHAERHNGQLAVIFIDLDHFKHINDSLGHTAGDDLLKNVADNLVQALRQEDTVARIGGDEFVLLLEDIGRPENIIVATEKLMSAFAGPFQLEGQEVRVTTSMGISLYPRDGEDMATLLRNADAAMYRAKDEGRNTYRFYTEELTRNAFERVLLENSLRKALENDELLLYYQPQLALRNRSVIGIEALLRWKHPELGLVPPSRFIALAEDSGLILPIGNWVLSTACAQAKVWLDAGIEFGRMAVNVAGPQIQRGGLVEQVSKVLQQSGLPADRLELEITEGFIMQQAEFAIDQLKRLREIGVTLAIDDFGTGYSSLSYLKQLPIQKLKIDQSFVRDIPADPNDMAIADAMIAMGKSLGLTVIAEGVETEEQADFLRRARCQEVQGYLYSRPICSADTADFLTFRARLRNDLAS